MSLLEKKQQQLDTARANLQGLRNQIAQLEQMANNCAIDVLRLEGAVIALQEEAEPAKETGEGVPSS